LLSIKDLLTSSIITVVSELSSCGFVDLTIFFRLIKSVDVRILLYLSTESWSNQFPIDESKS
jgi:hypothetical protein